MDNLVVLNNEKFPKKIIDFIVEILILKFFLKD